MDPLKGASGKQRFATAWLGGCSGCHMSFLDLDERLIDLLARVDMVYSPIIDVKTLPEGVDIAMVEGAIANEDHLRQAKRIRRCAKILVAFGDCAVTGNVTAMRNLFSVEDGLHRSYRESAVIAGVPTGNDVVPRLLERVLRLEDVVPVDYFLPGCPPSADVIHEFVSNLLAGRKPATDGRKFGS